MQALNQYLKCAGIFSLHIFLCIGLYAQGWQVKHYSVEDGLPHDVCYGIHQDQKGFMWIGTDLGLVRFDGNTFHPYGLEDGLPNPYIITVGETPQGQIWSTPYEGGIHYLEEEKFKKNPYVDPYFWYHPKVHYISDSIAFLQDLRTDLYSGITGLMCPGEASHFVRWYHINGELEGRRIQIENEADSYNKFLIHQTYDDDRVASLCFWSNRQYQLWLGTEEGLFMLDDPENLTTHLAHPDLAGVPVYGLHGNEVGDLIINSRSKIYLLQEDGSLSSFDLPSGVPSPPKIKISNGRKAYWGDALGAQFWTLDLKTGAFTSLTPYLQLGANISQFEIDREEGVWISTDGDGCHVLRNQGFQNLGKETGLKSLFINDFLLQDNSIFIAHKKGVEILEEIEGGRFQLIERSEYPKKEIYKLRNNDEGDIYISGLQGIRKIYPETKLLIPNQLPDVGLYQSNKFIMLLTDGVYIQSEGEKPEKWVEETYDKTLGDYGIEKGLHGDYYIRSKIGLLRLYPNSKSKTASGLISLDTIHIDLPILAITKSASGEIYYTSADSLYKLSPTGTQTFPLDRKQIGILKNIAVDDSNYVWLGTTTGLHKWSEKRTISFHEEDGLTSSDITSLYRDPKGRLWIGTSRGISLLRNPAKRQAREAPSIFLNSISLDGTPIEEEQLQQLKSTNTLNIKYDVIELQNPDNLSFQFQLYEGSAWQDVSSRELTLTNLSIGTYQVRFRAKNSQSDWREMAPLEFEIRPPWWSKWWAWLGIGSLLVLITSLIIRARIQSIKKQADARNELNQQMAHLQLSALQAQLNPHFIFNALNSIQYFIMSQDEIAANDYLTKFSRLMRLFLEASHSRTISLTEELELLELYIELEQLRFEGMFDYEIKLDEALDSDEIEVPSMMLQPFVENAINHGLRHKKEPGFLHIYFKKEENEVLCVIEDDGVGKAAARAIKARQNKNNKSYGMELLEDRIKVLNQIEGTQISIRNIDLFDANNKAAGTRVEIRLPI